MAARKPPTPKTRRPTDDRNAERPDWIRCAGTVFDIEWHDDQKEFLASIDDPTLSQDDNVMALTDAIDRLIKMGTWIGLDRQRENLFHEVMHACLSITGPDMGSMSSSMTKFADEVNWEEWFISQLDGPLVNTLRDNPVATRWMLGGA